MLSMGSPPDFWLRKTIKYLEVKKNLCYNRKKDIKI